MDVHVPTVSTHGGSPFAEHDMACAVCHTNKAVLELSTGMFQPCWPCQRLGYHLIKRNKFSNWLHG